MREIGRTGLGAGLTIDSAGVPGLLLQFVAMHRNAVSYQFDDVVLDPEAFSVEKSGQTLAIEPKSIQLLLYLIQNRARTVGKDELLRSVWEDVAVTDNALARVVAQLRKALGDDAKTARYIETVPTMRGWMPTAAPQARKNAPYTSLSGARERRLDAVRIDVHGLGPSLLPSNREGFVEFSR